MLRRVIVMLCLLAAVTGCHHTPPDYVSHYTPSSTTQAPNAPAAVAVIGGSFTTGTDFGGRGRNGWPALIATRLGEDGVSIIPTVGAEDGSGYATHGNDQRTVFADQVPIVVRPDDRLVVIFGSRSESDVPAEKLQPAVHQTLDAVHAAAPNAKTLVVGPVWTEPNPPENVLQTRDVIKSEAEAMGAGFVDPITDGWFVDRPDLISPDGTHPTDAGHAYIADKISPLIIQQLQSP